MKVLTTTIKLYGAMAEKARSLSTRDTHNQYDIICGCRSMADANRQCADAGLGNRVFVRDWASETYNEEQLAIAGNGGIFIKCEGKYYPIEEFGIK